MTSDMTTAPQESRGRMQRSRGGYSSIETWLSWISAHFIKLKSPKEAHYFQYREVIIWFSTNTGGQKFSKVFMFLGFKQPNNQKKLR